MRNSACFYCAHLRRKRLFTLCRDYNLTHLAFGHTAEDLVTTFFMNMIQGGRVDGLTAKDTFFGGELTIIRPMLLVEKSFISKAVRDWNLPVRKNTCPSSSTSRRNTITAEMDILFNIHKGSRRNVYNALRRWNCNLT
jgi:tRNA(Ile)-lysidine synthase TilS/MesJ